MRRCLLAVLGALVALVPSASAGIMYGTDGFTGDLVRIDTTTGASTVVGNMGIGNGIGLAVNGLTGVAYTRNFNNLYTVNLGTGATSLVGPSGSSITGLAFNAPYTTLYSVDQGSGAFYRVNPATGAATLVGNTGISTPLDLSTNSAGVIYGASISGGIYTINPLTGAATLVFSSVTADGLTAISFDETDTLYGVTLNGDHLVKINLVTGTSTIIGSPIVRQDIRGLDFVRVAAVPEPVSMVVFGGLLAAGGLAVRRRVKATVA